MRNESRIFVGSSSEQRKLATIVCEELRKSTFHPLPWWETGVFRAGDVTLDRLVQLSQLCEAAVLVFGADDKTWARGVEFKSVRDNVLLEYGLFLGRNDREHAVILAEKSAGIPSDLAGITVIHYTRGKETQIAIAEKVVNHFRRLLRADRDFVSKPSIVMHADSSQSLQSLDALASRKWSAPRLYEGLNGALAWLAVENDPEYRKRVQAAQAGAQIGRMVGDIPVSTVISLGPGAGSIDVEIMGNLTEHRWREYVPVDINQYLLLESAYKVSQQNPMTECVRGILCDFDKNLPFVGDTVKKHTNGPRLFLMAGGTFGNSLKSESSLLRGLYSIMEDDDLFLFDLMCRSSEYDNVEQDPLYNLSKCTKYMQSFFANGVRTILGEYSLSQDDAISRITVRLSHGTSLPGTLTLEYVENETQSVVVSIRRFKMDEITQAIEDAHFEIVSPNKVSSGILERHVILARKPKAKALAK
jgi:hypothetical protein